LKKNKLSLILISIILIILSISGCEGSVNKDEVSLNKIDISVIKNKEFLNNLNDNNLEDGIYLIEQNSKQYVLFNCKKTNYQNISCEFNEPELEIYVETKNTSEDEQKSLYEIVYLKNVTADTIKIIQDGRESSFSSVIIN